jgi:hypothetical protein
MSTFCCPVHGPYAPQPGVTLAICPACSSGPIGGPYPNPARPPGSPAEPWENEHAKALSIGIIAERDRLRAALEQIARMVESPRPHGPEVSRGAIRAVAREALRP